jgi:serine/threonine-protein kinase RsbW
MWCSDEEHFRVVKALEFSSYMAVPLTVGRDVLGSLTLVSAGSGRRFGPEDLALAEELAGYVAAVVDKARRYQEQQDTAQILESSLLPAHLPDVRGATLAVRYQAGTRGVEAGGDFYDVVQLRSGTLWLLIGDVAGHDREAAAMMGHLRSVARALVGQVRRPSSLIRALQRSWSVLDFDRIATALFCRLDPVTGELRIASAGHPAPLLVSADGARFVPVVPAPPFGGPRSRVPEWRGILPRGDLLLLYTDGVIQDRDRQLTVDEGMSLLATVAASCAPDPDAVCDVVLATLGADRADDVALLSVLLQSRQV